MAGMRNQAADSAKVSSNAEPSQVEFVAPSEHEEHPSSTFQMSIAPSTAASTHLTGWRLHLTTVAYVCPRNA